MGTQGAAQEVVGGGHVGHPVADGLVDGVLEGLAAAGDAPHVRAQEPHAEDVGLLAGHVHGAHVDDALDAQQGGGGGRGDAVLARPGLGHDAAFAHLALHEQGLAQGVVDLVGARVGQIFPLEVDLRAAQMFAEAAGIGDRGGPAHKGALEIGQLGHKLLVAPGFEIGFFQLIQGGHEGFGHKFAAVGAKVAALVRIGGVVDLGLGHGGLRVFGIWDWGLGWLAAWENSIIKADGEGN